MGLFDFIKNAGEKILNKDKQEHPDKNVVEQPSEWIIKNYLKKLDLGIKDLKVDVNDSTAVLYGRAESQEAREKAILAAGNVAGISKVEDKINVDMNSAQSRFYTVQSGDTLSKIAKQYYGDAQAYNKIFEANRPMLKDPDLIYPGQVLRIPEK